MSTTGLLEKLLAAEGEEEQKKLLAEHEPLEITFFQQLRDHVRKVVEGDAQAAVRVTDLGLAAIEFTQEQEGVAQAWWARGNALLFLGQHDDCLTAYSAAISILDSLGKVEEVAQLQTNCIPPLMWTGRYAEAQAMGHSALETLKGQGDTGPVANLLLNLGWCALRQGGHAEAVTRTEQAARIFARLGDVVQAARCQVTQAWALERLDRFTEAEGLLQNALQTFSAQRVWIPWARTALHLGMLRARLADYQIALHWLEKSRRGFGESDIEMDVACVDLYRVQCFLDVNMLPEAATLSEELVDTFTRLKMPRQVARAASLLAETYSRREQPDLALLELGRARSIFDAQGDTLEVTLLDLLQAALLKDSGRFGEALSLATQSAESLDVEHHPLRHAEAHLVIAECCQELGRIDEAQMAYRVAWAAGARPTGTTEPPPALAYHIAHVRGGIAEAAGDRPLARGEYDRAVGYLSRITQGLGLDELRGGYLADKRMVYESALRLALEDRRLEDAFRYSELARAGALRDFLASGRRPIPNEDEDRVVLDELRARWSWRVSGLRQPVDLTAETDENVIESVGRSTRLRELAILERELADAYRRMRLTDLRFAMLEQGDVLGLDAVRQLLTEDMTLLSFDHVDGQLLAFVITRDRIDAVPLGRLVQLHQDAAWLGHALEEIRLFDDPGDLAMLERELLEDLQALYRSVFEEPLALVGPDNRRLLIVPCGVLTTLPLEAFHDGRQHLLERYEICYLPSASLLAVLPEGRKARLGPPLVMAHSWDGRLPLVLEEAAGVTQALKHGFDQKPLLLAEGQATTEALHEYAMSASLVHIAAHGAFRSDAPLFSSLHLADGPLTVNEVYGLNLGQSALVTLSGCQTGLGQGWGGEMLGLTHAFFFAGAPTLVASRWRVEDETTAGLMKDFYAALAQGETATRALRTAQLSALSRQPHAGFWAAFAVWGRGFDPVFTPSVGGKAG